MILASPNDVLFDFGVVKIYYYGIIMALSVLLGLFACKIVCKKFYSDSDWETTYNLALGTIICGFLGARIYFVLASYKYFSNNLSEIFAIQNGGMSIHGAIIGGIIFAYFYLKKHKLSVLKYLDILCFGLISGQILGRWGNFFNSEAYGLPTFSFIKLYIPIEKRPPEFVTFDYFHPAFLYESLLNIVILCILIFLLKKKVSAGIITFTYILLYSVVRFFIEQIRIDSVLNFGDIPLAQAVSVFGVVIGLSGLILIKIFQRCGKIKE